MDSTEFNEEFLKKLLEKASQVFALRTEKAAEEREKGKEMVRKIIFCKINKIACEIVKSKNNWYFIPDIWNQSMRCWFIASGIEQEILDKIFEDLPMSTFEHTPLEEVESWDSLGTFTAFRGH